MTDAESMGKLFGVLVIIIIGALAGYKNGYYLKKLLGQKIDEVKP